MPLIAINLYSHTHELSKSPTDIHVDDHSTTHHEARSDSEDSNDVMVAKGKRAAKMKVTTRRKIRDAVEKELLIKRRPSAGASFGVYQSSTSNPSFSCARPLSLDVQFINYNGMRFHLSTPSPDQKTLLLLSMNIQCWDELV
jgi:hypothetical protein